MGYARYTLTSLRTGKRRSASSWTQRSVITFLFSLSVSIYIAPFAHFSCPADRLPRGMQCGRDAPSPPKPSRDDLARRSRIIAHSQRQAPLRRTNTLGTHFFPNQKSPLQSSQLANTRTPSPTRNLHDRAPLAHASRAHSALTCSRHSAHQQAWLTPHRLHNHRVGLSRQHICARRRLGQCIH